MLLKIRCYLSHKEQGFTFSLENTILEKVRAIVKIWSKRKISKKSEFSVYGIVQSCKLGDLKKYTLTFKFLSQLIFCHFASKLQSSKLQSKLRSNLSYGFSRQIEIKLIIMIMIITIIIIVIIIIILF